MASTRLSIHILLRHDFDSSGPPGSGKTRTIGAAAKLWDSQRRHAWIVAHSNVAVLNIAKTLEKCAVDFKLLVSREFHFEWSASILSSP